jgi:hypothetical protein
MGRFSRSLHISREIYSESDALESFHQTLFLSCGCCQLNLVVCPVEFRVRLLYFFRSNTVLSNDKIDQNTLRRIVGDEPLQSDYAL